MRISVVVLMMAVFACQKTDGKGRGQGDRGAVAVRTETVASRPLPHSVEVVAVLTGRRQADVYSRVPGKVSHIGPKEGQKVNSGALLFRVDRSEPGESFLATPVLSPISGWVGRWHVRSLGAQVTPQDIIVTVVDDEALRAYVDMPTKEWLLVSPATPVSIRVGDDVRPGKVVGVSRAAEGTSSRGTATVEVANAEHQWKAGMVAVVTFNLDERPRIVVPTGALSITDQGNFVFVVEGDKARRVPVTFRAIDNDRVEIVSGLEAGVELIVEGVNQVGDNIAVKVVNAESESAS